MTQNNVQLQNGNGSLAGYRNAIINGDFKVTQRPVDVTNTPGGTIYVTDRWGLSTSGSSTLTSTSVKGGGGIDGKKKNFLRTTINSGTFTNWFIFQKIEDVNNFAGRQVTVSFYARGSASGDLTVSMEQNFGTAGSTSVNIAGDTITVGTDWTRYSVAMSVPNVLGKTRGDGNFLALYLTPSTNTAGYRFDVTEVQVEEGPIATPFEERPYGLELVLCQRYYNNVTSPVTLLARNNSGSIFARYFRYFFPTFMRTTPTVDRGAISGGGSLVVSPAGKSCTFTATANSAGTNCDIDGIYFDAEL